MTRQDHAGALTIVMVHERFAPDYGGGGEYVVLEIAKHLIAMGHRVRVVTTGDPAHDSFDGVPLVRLPVSRYRFNLCTDAIAATAAGADLIHCFTYHAAWPSWRAGRRLGIPVVLGVLALFGPAWREMRKGPVSRLFQWFEAFLLRLAFARQIFLSPGSLRLAQGLRPARATDCVIAPGISLQDYGPASEREGVVFSGKLDVRKGTQALQQLARELPDIPFLVVAWGDDFEAFARSSPPNMTVQRFVDRQHLAAALGSSRLFLFPTKAETFGLVVAEAMASGCAVVSSAPLEFEGARIDPDDLPGIKLAVRQLWEDPVRCAACGQRNMALAQAYSWHRHMDSLTALYRSLCGVPSDRIESLAEKDDVR
ncbi:MAG: glycosyltransferase [Burkholderiales bacterium]|nr:MAG: glycosyltransferase [Burkholderiales bacterium]